MTIGLLATPAFGGSVYFLTGESQARAMVLRFVVPAEDVDRLREVAGRLLRQSTGVPGSRTRDRVEAARIRSRRPVPVA